MIKISEKEKDELAAGIASDILARVKNDKMPGNKEEKLARSVAREIIGIYQIIYELRQELGILK